MLRQLMQKRNLLILLVLVGASASAQLPFLSSDEKPSLAPLLKMVTPAVVNISSTAQVPEPFIR
jgi:S1-C subfamily serine protease